MTIFVPDLNAEVETRHDPRDNPMDVTLCARIGRILIEHYPGWTWDVDIQPNQRVITIRNKTCNPRGHMGFVLYKDKLDPGLKMVVRGGGEFLERYRMRAGRLTEDQLEGKIMELEKPDL